MIGVLAPASLIPAVEAFFEIFKTPWEPYTPGRPYAALIDAGPETLSSDACKVILRFPPSEGASAAGRGGRRKALEGIRPVPALGLGSIEVPLYGTLTPVQERGTLLAASAEGDRPAVVAERTPQGLVLRFGYALFAEVDHLLRHGQTAAEASVPTLDLHASLLRTLLLEAGVPLVEIPPMPAGHPFAVALTHDIDHPLVRRHRFNHTTAGFLGRALLGGPLDALRGRISAGRALRGVAAAARLPAVHAGWAEDFWADFDRRYLALEKGLGGTYYVLPVAGHAGRALDGGASAPARRASSYGAPDLLPQLSRLRAAGCEIGLHGLDAWAGAEEGRHERTAAGLDEAGGEVGVRMHWLYFGPDSPGHLEAAGFTYDSTAGFNETIGFRAGTAQVYRPPGCRTLLELPLHVMDTALFYPSYLHLTDDEARKRVSVLVGHAASAGGVVTFNWHDRSLAPERLWGGAYAAMLDDLRAHAPWFATAGAIVAWFRGRRAASFDGASGVPPDEGPSPGAAARPLPAYRLRTYTPSGGLLGAGPGQRRTTWRETEF